MSRWKAAGIHLSISIAIGLIVGALLFGVWYPPPFFHAAGADQLVLLLVSVDIVLGPLLTLVVFKSGKRGLKFDLALIGFMQSVALVYGLSIVLRSRPVFLVAAVDRFALVSAADIGDVDLAQGRKPEFRTRSWTGPVTVGAQLPPPGKARTEILFSSLKGKDVETMPKFYVDYSDISSEFLTRAKPVSALAVRDPDAQRRLDSATRESGLSPAQLLWVPIVALKANMVMLLDAQNGKPIRAVAVNPWPN